jgi:gamma-glutamylaminecyclotransferase
MEPTLPTPRTLLFVYGTLKRGGRNHAWMLGQEYLGEARSAPGATLYSLGEYPGLVADPADREGVRGEVWAVDPAALARLDDFEGVLEGLYAREPIALAERPPSLSAEAAARVEGYRYLRPVSGRPRLGDFWPV